MEQAISDLAARYLTDYSFVAIIIIFLGGVITSLGPCNLSMIPVLMAYVGGDFNYSRARGFALALFFTLGSSATFVVLGVTIALFGGIFGLANSILYYIVALVCFLVGLHMMGYLHISTSIFNRFQVQRPQKTGYLSSFFLGAVMGLVGNQCGTPILLVILTFVFAKGKLLYGALLLFFYGLGRGVPVVLAGTFTGLVKNLGRFQRYQEMLNKAAGAALLLVGVYFFWHA
ncbi:cytochrome c biogenesis CcdA family protein [Metallumcola ferriviriculae]|uniref:Cytochrome c biogenesis CcdA family protein n=1 Tax=Metallumcola ferriviriculae TaxID=3039180 RepID=A0AAU0UMI2_9FIRM|nr:cytochrome c biogenesis CcdA family protein [Desulfitibacteraceae bacterium MK1]